MFYGNALTLSSGLYLIQRRFRELAVQYVREHEKKTILAVDTNSR